jgi:hypothetical protein
VKSPTRQTTQAAENHCLKNDNIKTNDQLEINAILFCRGLFLIAESGQGLRS